MSTRRARIALAAAFVALWLFAMRTVPAQAQTAQPAGTRATEHHNDAAAAAAFEAIVPVLHSPRCMNCHSPGDFPRQGDDEHPHTMGVRRGPAGMGAAPVKCSACHQDHNLAGAHMPPGAPGWHLPPPGMAMIWAGLSDRQLCESFKDPRRNGGRDVAQIVEHMNSPLVRWGWHPGEGRTPISLPQGTFLADVREWASSDAACPDDAAPRTQASPQRPAN